MPPLRCLLLVDPPAGGAWNMAVDEALLEWSAAAGSAALRFYEWNEPTLSLGFFQRLEERASHAASAACPVVRRLTGGGAIVHHRELTYSIVLPAEDPMARRRDDLYDVMHESLIDALQHWGLYAARVAHAAPPGAGGAGGAAARDESGHSAESAASAAPREPFLCFERRAAGDVVIKQWKIAGSAQRRRRGAVLQHGSVLLAHSPVAPELQGVWEASTQWIDVGDLWPVWISTLRQRWPIEFHPGELTAAQQATATALAETRFAAESWTRDRALRLAGRE